MESDNTNIGDVPIQWIIDLTIIDWVAIGAIATAVAALINVGLITSIFIGLRSIRQSEKARNASVFVWMIQQIEEIKSDEALVLDQDTEFVEWNEQVLYSARKVANRYQRVCYAAQSGLIDKEHLRDMFGPNIVWAWNKLEPWIVSERNGKGDKSSAALGAFMRRHFEVTAHEFKKYYDRNHPAILNDDR